MASIEFFSFGLDHDGYLVFSGALNTVPLNIVPNVTTVTEISSGGADSTQMDIKVLAGIIAGGAVVLGIAFFSFYRYSKVRKQQQVAAKSPAPAILSFAMEPHPQKSFASSKFKLMYSHEARQVKSTSEVLELVLQFLEIYARQHSLDRSIALDFHERLKKEALDACTLENELDDVAKLAQRIWSSDQCLTIGDAKAAKQLEFCSILNFAIRTDEEGLLEKAMPIIRAINSLCVVRGVRADKYLRFPPEHRCFRGTGMPMEHARFYRTGLKYRVPGFLASSFHRKVLPPSSARSFRFGVRRAPSDLKMDCPARSLSARFRRGPILAQVANGFMCKAFDRGLACVLLVIKLDPQGVADI